MWIPPAREEEGLQSLVEDRRERSAGKHDKDDDLNDLLVKLMINMMVIIEFVQKNAALKIRKLPPERSRGQQSRHRQVL